ncbi:MAG TPA: tetratricopeptide repeat protein [Vicinamibacterales bacterium]|nr:tetratricopeptide repeat protein [Vicinamibacterales bacterium]
MSLVSLVLTSGANAVAAPITYTKDIAPLVNDRCGMCHHPSGSAPFSLLTYGDVKRRATQIADVTKKRFMPPWKADPGNGPFIGQEPLTGDEIARIQQWVDAGAPEGSPANAHDAASPLRQAQGRRAWTEGWQLGAPDLVVSLPQPYTLQAEGTDVFRVFVIPLPVDRLRFVRGLEFRPGNPKVVHHANIRVDHTGASRALDEADPGPGYNGLIPHSAQYPDGHFLGWTPGQVAPLLPDDLAWRLDRQTDLVVQIHMQPSGKPEAVQPSIGLYFGDRPPARTPAMLRIGRQGIDIPAGEKAYTITDSYTLPVDVEVQAVQPHAHYRARDVRGEARLPDGTVKPLIHIRDWDFRWQHVYRYAAPFRLPKGTTLSMRYVYDNSPDNLRNPEHPPKRARWGQRSSDEMGDLWIQVLTRDEPDLDKLTADFRPKVANEDAIGYEMEIARAPADAALHDDAAMLYLELRRYDEAIRHFSTSLELKPGSAVAHYNLGTALTFARRFDDAAREYQAAIGIDPRYPKAHNNLGNVWLAQQKYDEAIREFEEVTRLQPDSVSALANLAAAYAAAGRFDRAVATADAALKLNPSEPVAGDIRRQKSLYAQRKRPEFH